MRARDFVKRNVAYHSELNPVAWSHGQLRPEVRKHLLKIAEVFEHYLEIPNFEVQDIVLTGSMANYNYTRYSDFDLHIVADYTDLQCDDFAEAFYQAKKKIWNDAHDITIRGHEVELYVEDIKRTAVSGGVYSIQENDWIKEPSYDPPVIDNTAVNLKVLDLVKRINSTIKERDHLSMKALMDKLRKMRRSGLDTEGEFGVENLAFKILRNQGYIDRLQHAEIDHQDAELSLKENKQQPVNEDNDYMAGHCHVMALALKQLHPDWQIRAHIGWDEDAEDDDYRVDHVYVVSPDGAAYDCRGRFDSEQQLVGADETGGEETQLVNMDQAEIDHLVTRHELKPYTQQQIATAQDIFKRLDEAQHPEPLTKGSFTIQLNKDHLIDRTQQRQVNPADVDTILNQVPRLKAKILKYVIGEEFWIYNPKLNTSVGMRMISPERRVLRANTAILGRSNGDRNPTIVIH